MQFKVEKSCHGLNCIQAHDMNPALCLRVKRIALDNDTRNISYKLAKQSGAFLQGFDVESGWIFIEFWKEEYQEFVDYVNKRLLDPIKDWEREAAIM